MRRWLINEYNYNRIPPRQVGSDSRFTPQVLP